MIKEVFHPTEINNLTDKNLKNKIIKNNDSDLDIVNKKKIEKKLSLEEMYKDIKHNHEIWIQEKQQIKQQIETALDEFKEMIRNQDALITEGIHFSRKLLEKAEYSLERPQKNIPHPFDIVKKMEPSLLLNFIQNEQPQTIALILAYLDPKKASIMLQNLFDDVQSEVVRRIATMDRTSPDILREVERVLEKKLEALPSEDNTIAGGIENIVEILKLVDQSSEKSIIEALEKDDPDLAEEIKKQIFVFEDIVMLDDNAIQKLIREVDTQELKKALISADTEVQGKIFQNMSERAATMLKEDIKFMGPIRIKDVEESQQKIISTIRRLEGSGEIIIDRSSKNDLEV